MLAYPLSAAVNHALRGGAGKARGRPPEHATVDGAAAQKRTESGHSDARDEVQPGAREANNGACTQQRRGHNRGIPLRAEISDRA